MDATEQAWRDAFASFERELSTRGVSRHTLRAYGSDIGELIAWASGRDRGPGQLVYRDLRAYAAVLSERGLARAREFNWQRSAEAALDVYHHVLASRRP